MATDWFELLPSILPLLMGVALLPIGLVVIIIFRSQLTTLIHLISDRVKNGASIKFFEIFELGSAQTPDGHSTIGTAVNKDNNHWDWKLNEILQSNRDMFLTHIFYPSETLPSGFDIFIYLLKVRSTGFDTIRFVDFYLGEKEQRVQKNNDLIGISVTADKPFLCACKVTFGNGDVVELHRYIDFEMKSVFSQEI